MMVCSWYLTGMPWVTYGSLKRRMDSGHVPESASSSCSNFMAKPSRGTPSCQMAPLRTEAPQRHSAPSTIPLRSIPFSKQKAEQAFPVRCSEAQLRKKASPLEQSVVEVCSMHARSRTTTEGHWVLSDPTNLKQPTSSMWSTSGSTWPSISTPLAQPSAVLTHTSNSQLHFVCAAGLASATQAKGISVSSSTWRHVTVRAFCMQELLHAP
mmetsp:Transcript_18707/g.42450  ORF Transcript_18707/g.42450 Transcript_18707/m.42450 type:complete len:210 (+) Transcript_18707:68-697(+)